MPRGNPNWTKGVSGNPQGRPPKSRTLTAILESAGGKTVDVVQPDGSTKRVAGKRVMARMLWDFVLTGEVILPSGESKKVEDFSDWFNAVKFIYQHIDGPPPSKHELSGPDGQPIELTWPSVPGSDDDA